MKTFFKVLMGLVILCPLISLASNFSAEPGRQEIQKRNEAYLKKMGIHMLDGQIRVVPAQNFIKTLVKNNDDEYVANKIKTYLAMHQEQQANGFVKESEPRAKELMNFHRVAPYQLKKYRNERAASSTHLRGDIKEIKMAYTFVGVPQSDMDNFIGVAPFGAYKQIKNGDDGEGWDGVMQFFEKKNLGNCAFTEHNLKLAHGGVELIKELVSYEISGKPTVILVKGTNDSGFIYRVQWYDNTFSRQLECSNQNYSRELLDKVLELANNIESNQ